MIPATVPKSPTNGAVVEIVARLPRPFFISAVVISVSRSRARLPDSTTSKSSGSSSCVWYSNSVRPAFSTRAKWLWRKRLSPAKVMASPSLCCWRSGTTPLATSSDSRFAFWKRHSRSIAIVSDQMDMRASTITTPFATQFIECHIPMRLKLVSIPCICAFSSLLQTEVDCQIEDHGDGLSVERAGGEFPALDRVERGLIETHRQALEDAHVRHVAFLVDDGLEDDHPFDARLAGHLGVLRVDALGGHDRLHDNLGFLLDVEPGRDHAADDGDVQNGGDQRGDPPALFPVLPGRFDEYVVKHRGQPLGMPCSGSGMMPTPRAEAHGSTPQRG